MLCEVASDIFEIDTKPLGIEQVNASYLIKGNNKTILIDPGFPTAAEVIKEELKAGDIDPESIDYIAVTHTHIDHAGAAGQLAEIAKNAKVVVYNRGVFYLKNAGKISGGGRMVFGEELANKLGETVNVGDDRILSVADNDSIDLGDKKLTIHYTPGHVSNHISFFEEATGTLFSGDTCCLHYPHLGHYLIPAASPPIYKTDDIISELKHFLTLDIKTILTPHFGKPDMEPAVFLEKNIETVMDTREKIEAMFKQGLESPQVIEKLRSAVLENAGEKQSAPPEMLSETWLRTMLKIGLMGLMADILQYARDLRAFH